jgi:hypothetical protein
LRVIHADVADWPEHVACEGRAGANFLLVLTREPGAVDRLCTLLQLEPKKLPKPLRRSNLFLLSPHIAPQEFDRMLQAMEDGHQVFFFEQLELPGTQPPRVKRYLVYCDLWGIISQHDDVRDASTYCSDYANSLNVQRATREASIYKWNGAQWQSVQV